MVVAAAAFFVFASSRKGKDAGGKARSERRAARFRSWAAAPPPAPSPFAVKRLNDKLDSYAYAFEGATVSPESAERAKVRRAFDDKYAATLGKLTAGEREAVARAGRSGRREDAALRRKMAAAARRMRAQAVTKAGKKGGDVSEADAEADAALEEAFPFLDLDEAEDLEERAAARAASSPATRRATPPVRRVPTSRRPSPKLEQGMGSPSPGPPPRRRSRSSRRSARTRRRSTSLPSPPRSPRTSAGASRSFFPTRA